MPYTPAEKRLHAWGFGLIACWLLAAVAGPGLLEYAGIVLNPHGHAPLYAHGHPFVDARHWGFVPNALDVLSNLPLVLVGVWGLMALRRRELSASARQAVGVFFVGMVLTGLGSAVYHWAPNAATLVLDRLGMAVTFAGALSLAAAGRVSSAAARCTLGVVMVLALLSALMPLTHDNALPWLVVQFGGLVLLGWTALQKQVPGALRVRLGLLIALYVVAKVFELGDAAVFHTTGDWVSGHSLKHLVAALVAWPVIHAVRQNAATTVHAKKVSPKTSALTPVHRADQ
jgi:predicted membrane channel-forming protein YqfA (hemolysin III family)